MIRTSSAFSMMISPAEYDETEMFSVNVTSAKLKRTRFILSLTERLHFCSRFLPSPDCFRVRKKAVKAVSMEWTERSTGFGSASLKSLAEMERKK